MFMGSQGSAALPPPPPSYPPSFLHTGDSRWYQAGCWAIFILLICCPHLLFLLIAFFFFEGLGEGLWNEADIFLVNFFQNKTHHL